MRIALAMFASFAIFCSALFAADNPKTNKMTKEMSNLVIQPSLARAKMKDQVLLKGSVTPEQMQATLPKDMKKTKIDPSKVKMNKIDDKTSKLMLKSSAPKKMKDSGGPKYADKIESLQTRPE